MARIRTIKPEAPQSESLGRISRDARLLFFMLFTVADDEGRARAAPRMLAGLLFPYDEDAPSKIAQWLAELEREKCIAVYAVDGNTYLSIVKWAKHQKIEKPKPSRFPTPPSQTPREASRQDGEASRPGDDASPPDQGRDQGEDQGPDQGMDREEDRINDPDLAAAASFEEFWTLFDPPMNARKPDALKAWGEVAEKRPPLADLRKAVTAYNSWLAAEWTKNKREFPSKQHPATWLRGHMWERFSGAPALSAEEIEANKDRADRLMRRGKYAVSYQ